MPDVELPTFSIAIERAAASLDAQVRDALRSLRISGSPQTWNEQLEGILAGIYRSTVRRTKETIRAVAQEFRGTDRTKCLVDGARSTIGRIDMLQNMVTAMEVLTLSAPPTTEIESGRLERLRGHIPTLRDAVGFTISNSSRWQDEFGVCQDVFSILELPVDTLEPLLDSLSASLPEAHLVRGRIVMRQLIALWDERRVIEDRAVHLVGSEDEARHLAARLDVQREIQDSIMASFSALLEQLDDASSTPVCFLGQEFPVSRFLDAGRAFSRLSSQQMDVYEALGRLERIADRFMDVVEA